MVLSFDVRIFVSTNLHCFRRSASSALCLPVVWMKVKVEKFFFTCHNFYCKLSMKILLRPIAITHHRSDRYAPTPMTVNNPWIQGCQGLNPHHDRLDQLRIQSRCKLKNRENRNEGGRSTNWFPISSSSSSASSTPSPSSNSVRFLNRPFLLSQFCICWQVCWHGPTF